MCTPLMAQRCLLHHTALATGFCLFPALKRSTGCLRARKGGMRQADCTWHSKDNRRDVFDVWEHAHAPALHLRGNTLSKSCCTEPHWIRKKTLVTVSLEWKCFQDHLSHMSAIVKINTATLFLWQRELLCAGMRDSSDESPARRTSQPYLSMMLYCTAAKRNPKPCRCSNDLTAAALRFTDYSKLRKDMMWCS